MRFGQAKGHSSRRAENCCRACALALLLLIASPLHPTSNEVVAEPAAPAYLAGGVTPIPYTDPYSRPTPRRDLYVDYDDEPAISYWVPWLLLVLLAGVLLYLLRNYLRPKPKPKPKPDWTNVETAINDAFKKRVTEANVHLKGDVQSVAVNVLNEAKPIVVAAAKAGFEK